MFQVDTASAMPAVTWLGCVVAPDPIGLNSVRGLPDGGFITTNFLPRGGTPEAMQQMMGGARNGELWEWHTATGWQKVPGSEAAGANGVELSDDGKTLVRRGLGQPIVLPLVARRDAAHARRDPARFPRRQHPLGARRHAVRRRSGGAELEGRQDRSATRSRSARSSRQADTPEFGAGTALVEVGNKLWVGSFRGNRIAIVPAP